MIHHREHREHRAPEGSHKATPRNASSSASPRLRERTSPEFRAWLRSGFIAAVLCGMSIGLSLGLCLVWSIWLGWIQAF